MSIRNLQFAFKPRSVALVVAGEETGTIGKVLARNLLNSGFEGPIMPIDATRVSIEGVLTYADVAALPTVPDLTVIATPPETVPRLIDDFGRRGTRAAVVISGGFGEGGEPAGQALRLAMLEAAGRHRMRIIGPNCIGVIAPPAGLNASFAHRAPPAGKLAFVAQSGGIIAAVLDWANARGIGFSHFVSLGDMADVDLGDMLDYLAQQSEVRAILLYAEAITQARKFMSAGRAAARLKPVVIVKSGRFAQTARAVVSHTGALAGADKVCDAAFRRAGMLRVHDIGDLFGAVETLGAGQPVAGDRLAILTNGGGAGIIATDALLAAGGRLADLSDATLATLNAALPPAWSHGNPVDIGGDAPARRYAEALDILLEDANADAILVLNCPTAVSSSGEAARAVIGAKRDRRRCVLTCWLGEEAVQEARHLFNGHHLPTYLTPERAVRAFMHLVEYRRNQEALTQTPPSIPEAFAIDAAAAGAVFERALAEGREWLSEPESKAVLAAYGIPVVATEVAGDAQAAEAAAARLGGPVVLKILSPDIMHKSDAGGVALDLRTPAMVRDAAEAMLSGLRRRRPDARLTGFTVQPMIERPDAVELILGVYEDPQFGPVILFGQGGTAAEIIDDTALALPPLNMHLAREVMTRTRVDALLRGFRGRPAAAIDDVALTLIKLSHLIIDFAEVVELDINPLLAGAFGVLALDARIRLRRAEAPAAKRLAIRPYPKDLEETLSLPDGRALLLRPVLPEDEPAFQELFGRLSAEDVRLRFFAPKKALSHPFAARLTQIDYDREMALVLAQPGVPGRSEVFGVVHISADPDGERAEYAILLRSDMSGLGLGPLLMRRIIEYGRARGIKELFGEVLRENRAMLRVCELFKFSRMAKEDEPGVYEVTLRL